MIITLTLRGQTCANCGVAFGLETGYDDERRKDHKTFYCPNGHTQWYPGKTEKEKLEEQLEAAQSLAQREARRRARAEQECEAAQRQTRAYKGHITRLKRRVAKGKCPCCRALFPDVAAHVATAHPGYAQSDISGAP